MEGRKQLNVHAPVFEPGNLQKGNEWEIQSPARPLIVYGDLDRFGRSLSNPICLEKPREENSTVDNSARTIAPRKRTTRTRARHTANPGLAYQRLQTLVGDRRRMYPEVDNTQRAMEARFFFDMIFGRDEHDLQSWQDVCFFCGRSPEIMPRTILHCKKFLGRININIFDLVDSVRLYKLAEPQFDDSHDLEIYSRQTGKICPAAVANGNQIFRFMLKKWFR